LLPSVVTLSGSETLEGNISHPQQHLKDGPIKRHRTIATAVRLDTETTRMRLGVPEREPAISVRVRVAPLARQRLATAAPGSPVDGRAICTPFGSFR
jgi:hypothetical protein